MKSSNPTQSLRKVSLAFVSVIKEIKNAIELHITNNSVQINQVKYIKSNDLKLTIRGLFAAVIAEIEKAIPEEENDTSTKH